MFNLGLDLCKKYYKNDKADEIASLCYNLGLAHSRSGNLKKSISYF